MFLPVRRKNDPRNHTNRTKKANPASGNFVDRFYLEKRNLSNQAAPLGLRTGVVGRFIQL